MYAVSVVVVVGMNHENVFGRDGARRKKDKTGTRPVKLEKMYCLLTGRDRKFVV
jgi:hypothetical protein